MSEDSAQYDTPGEDMRSAGRRHGGGVGRETLPQPQPRRFDEQGAGSFAGNDGASTADEDAVGRRDAADFFGLAEEDSAKSRSHSAAEYPANAAGERQRLAQAAAGAAETSTTTTAMATEEEEGIALSRPHGAGTTVPSSAATGQPSSEGGQVLASSAPSAIVIPGAAAAVHQRQQQQQQKKQEGGGDLHGAGAPVGRTGAPGKEDGSGWSDQDTFSSAAPSPLEQGEGQEYPRRHAGPGDGNPNMYPSRPRPSPIQVAEISSKVPSSTGQEEEEEGGGGGGGAARATTVNEASSGSANVSAVNLRLSPAKTPLRHHQQAHKGPPGMEFGGVSAGVRGGGEGERGDVGARGRADSVGRGVGSAGAGNVGSTAATSAVAAVSAAAPLQGAPPSPSSFSGRERQGLGNLLRMGVKKVGRHGGDTEALKAEAAELRAEVEELSLELEDAEDR